MLSMNHGSTFGAKKRNKPRQKANFCECYAIRLRIIILEKQSSLLTFAPICILVNRAYL